MPKVKVRLLKRHGRLMPGETVEISRRDLKPMVAMGRVELIDEQAPQPVKATPRKRVAPKPVQKTAKAAPKPLAAAPAKAPIKTALAEAPAHTTTAEVKRVAMTSDEVARNLHMRRDIAETQSPSVEELRARYKRRFGEDADLRWGIPRLTQELAAAHSRSR